MIGWTEKEEETRGGGADRVRNSAEARRDRVTRERHGPKDYKHVKQR